MTTESGRPSIRGQIRIDLMRPADADAVLAIYGEGIATGISTFDTIVPTWAEWDAAHRPDCRFVAKIAGQVVGWTALVPYSARSVYAGVAWESVYVTAAARGQGIGAALLARLRAGRHLDADGRHPDRERREPATARADRLPADRRPAARRPGRRGPMEGRHVVGTPEHGGRTSVGSSERSGDQPPS